MRRGLALTAAVVVTMAATGVRADELDPQIEQLGRAESYKVRLAAAINLSKRREAKAVAALSTALIKDEEPTIRRVCALALSKIVDDTTPAPTRKIALAALDHAAKTDRDSKVRDAAGKAYAQLATLVTEPAASGPGVFVNVGSVRDLTHKGPSDLEKRLGNVVRGVVKHSSYAVEWADGGGLPTHADLTRAGTQGFFVAATVPTLDIKKSGGRSEISCSVSIRVAPWEGSDGAEKWEASKAASATGSGRAETGGSDRAVDDGIRDCVLAVAEEVAQRQVVPFIKRLASSAR
jgi:HEAT repeats